MEDEFIVQQLHLENLIAECLTNKSEDIDLSKTQRIEFNKLVLQYQRNNVLMLNTIENNI